MKYSVIIPCRNGESTLARQLEALARQDFVGDWEILVADNGSEDSSADLVRRYLRRMPNLLGLPHELGCFTRAAA